MSELQKQAIAIITDMSEENLKVLVHFMQIFVLPQNEIKRTGSNTLVKAPSKRIGIAEGEELYAPDYDIDEYNEEIAKMFGGM